MVVMNPLLRHFVKTPTFALTLAGCALLAASLADRRARGAEVPAFILLTLAGAAVATALQDEVREQGRVWEWKGIAAALRRPSRRFLVGFAVHLPQLLAAGLMALAWRGSASRGMRSSRCQFKHRCKSTSAPFTASLR